MFNQFAFKDMKKEKFLLSEDELRYSVQWYRRRIRDVIEGKVSKVDYGAAVELCSYLYEREGYLVPFVVECKNPVEMHLMKNLFFILSEKGEKGFMSRFQECLSVVRGSGDSSELREKVSKLYEYVLPLCVKLFSKLSYQSLLEEVELPRELVPYYLDHEKFAKLFFTSYSGRVYDLNFSSDYVYVMADILSRRGERVDEVVLKVKSLRERANVMEFIFCRDVVFVVPFPSRIHVDASGRWHNTKGVAVSYDASHPILVAPYYYIHGRYVHNYKLITEGFTFEDFLNCTREDERAFMFEIISDRSPDAIVSFFNLVEVDKQTVQHVVDVPYFNAQGEFVGEKTEVQEETIVLYHTKKSFSDVIDPLNPTSKRNKLAWIKFICPSTGTTYMIYTSPSFRNVVEAAKYARPFQIKNDYTWKYRS